MIHASDTPTSQSAAVRWTCYRRLGLLLRTRLDDDGATFSLHDIAARTRGRVSPDELIAILRQGAQAEPDAVTCVILAQAFDIDPDFFVNDDIVREYIDSIRAANGATGASRSGATLQRQTLMARPRARVATIAD